MLHKTSQERYDKLLAQFIRLTRHRLRSGERGGEEGDTGEGRAEGQPILLVGREREAEREGLQRHEALHPKLLCRQAVSRFSRE